MASLTERKSLRGTKARLTYFTPDSTRPFFFGSRGGQGEIKKPYPKQLVVSSTPYEVRVALLENNVAVEFLQEWKCA